MILQVFINGGILIGYISNYAFSKLTLKVGWRMMLGVGAIPSVLLTVGVLAMPESPRWLVMRGRLGEARKVLNKTSDSKEEAQLRLAEIKQAAGIPESCNDDVVQVNKRSTGEGVWKELFLVLDWGGTRDVGLQLRNISVEVAGAGYGCGC